MTLGEHMTRIAMIEHNGNGRYTEAYLRRKSLDEVSVISSSIACARRYLRQEY